MSEETRKEPVVRNSAPTRLRQFNDAGIGAFRQYLQEARNNRSAEPPWAILEDPALTRPVTPAVEVDRPGFRTKRDAAEYLKQRLSPLRDRDVLNNAGLWTWLTLFYFDDVCPPVNGRRRVLGDTMYVYEPGGLMRQKHLLAISCRILLAAPGHNRLLLDAPLEVLGAVIQEVMGRLFLTRVPCIFEVLDRLYFDEERGRAKKGLFNNTARPGDLRNRLPLRMRQLEKTYDLHLLNADQLIALLGREFHGWLDRQLPLSEDRPGQGAADLFGPGGPDKQREDRSPTRRAAIS